MKTIPLTQGHVALIDDEDFEGLSKFKWHAAKRGRKIYASRHVRNPNGSWTKKYMHQSILPTLTQVDHRDGDGRNNQRFNLREATNTQNNRAAKRKSLNVTSQFRGVSWDAETSLWKAQIGVLKKTLNLGRFSSEKDAALAYDAAAIEHYGEFASPNFP